jgi:hypothetical protein
MYTSQARIEEVEYLRYLVRHKYISSAQFKHEKAKVDRREAKAVALREAKRAAAAAAAAARRKAKSAALAKAKKAAKVEAMLKKKKVLVVVKIDYQKRSKANPEKGWAAGEWKNASRTVDIETTRENAAKDIKAEIEEVVDTLEADSPIDVKNAKGTVVSTSAKVSGLYAGASIKMKLASALNLDNGVVQTWDTGKGRCVFDFIIWRYGPHHKKLCTYEMLEAIILADDPTSNPIEEGVSATQCISIANVLGVRLLALDEDQNIILQHTPSKIRKDLPPLNFRVKNEHFYAIMDQSLSLAQIKNVSSMTHFKKEDEKKEKKPMQYHILKDTDNRIDQMVSIMKAANTEVFNGRDTHRNINFNSEGELCGFTLKGVKYAWDEDNSILNAMEIAKINERPYCGETVFSILMDLMESLGYMKKRSTPNPHTYATFTAENVKFRTHYGATSELFTRDQLADLVSSGEAIAVDIAKCYTSVLEQPMAGWYIFDSKCEWTVPGKTILPGLYLVETDDMSLFHGSNIYSDTMISKAMSENIAFKIRCQMLPSTILASDYFAPLLDAIDTLCKGDKTLKKSLTNIITGYLGKTQTKQVMAKLTTDIHSVWNDYTKPEYQEDAFLRQSQNYYVYGRKQTYRQTEINVPMYIQILDQSNIRLYDMIKQSGGELLARKTDCAIIRGGSLTYGSMNGEYRPCDVPLQMGLMRPAAERSVSDELFFATSWFTHVQIYSSSQYEDIYNILKDYGGCLLDARAGTGKTYAALAIEKLWMKTENACVIKFAFTNKAALNFGGKTFHKFLKMDGKGRFNLTWVKSLKNKNVLFIGDESSMNGEFIWTRLVELKKALPNATFLFLGDKRQCQPVEDCEAYDYFNSETVKWLCKGHRVELTERQRYDQALWKFAEDVYERGITGPVGKTVNDAKYLQNATNICFLNKTRKFINGRVNDYVASFKDEVFPAPAGKSEYSQDCLLYVGMPIIAHTNFTKGGILQCVNSETFTIKSITAETMTVVSTRTEGEHLMTLATSDFAKYFLPNYCTTTHKLQGATITGPINIFDWSRMPREVRYTACTRAKKLSQISMV